MLEAEHKTANKSREEYSNLENIEMLGESKSRVHGLENHAAYEGLYVRVKVELIFHIDIVIMLQYTSKLSIKMMVFSL